MSSDEINAIIASQMDEYEYDWRDDDLDKIQSNLEEHINGLGADVGKRKNQLLGYARGGGPESFKKSTRRLDWQQEQKNYVSDKLKQIRGSKKTSQINAVQIDRRYVDEINDEISDALERRRDELLQNEKRDNVAESKRFGSDILKAADRADVRELETLANRVGGSDGLDDAAKNRLRSQVDFIIDEIRKTGKFERA